MTKEQRKVAAARGPAVVVLAGRRVDPPQASRRVFPLRNVPTVRRRIRALLLDECATILVSSAACGADLLALEEAGRLGVRRRVVLPFAPDLFRRTSVVDRPGSWGQAFDRVIRAVRVDDGLIVLQAETDTPFESANERLVREAQTIAGHEGINRLLAVVVWDGRPHQEPDASNGFLRLVVQNGFETRFVLTAL